MAVGMRGSPQPRTKKARKERRLLELLSKEELRMASQSSQVKDDVKKYCSRAAMAVQPIWREGGEGHTLGQPHPPLKHIV